jgi:hypothetical protein
LTVVVQDPGCSQWLRSSPRLKVVRRLDPAVAREAANIIVAVVATSLDRVAGFVREARARHHLRGLLIRTDLPPRWVQQMLARAGLRASSRQLLHEGSELPRRVFQAWRREAQDALIADALALPDRLLAVSCSLEPLEVRFDELAALRSLPHRSRDRFIIAQDGSYIHWPDEDIHLDLEALRFAVDPGARQSVLLERLRRTRRLGRAIRALRQKHGLRQSDVPGVSPRQIRRIEAGQFFPRTATLRLLATAHGTDLHHYLNQVASLISRPD